MKTAHIAVLSVLLPGALVVLSHTPHQALLAGSEENGNNSLVAHIVSRSFTGGGELRTVDYLDYAVRAEGSRAVILRRWTVGEQPSFIESRTVTDAAGGAAVTMFPHLGLKTSLPFAGRDVESVQRSPDLGCRDDGNATSFDASPNPPTLLGYTVVKRTCEQVKPSGQKYVIEEYSAPELGCFPLRKVIQALDPAGNSSVLKETNVINILHGNPPASMFEVRTDYAEASPSEVLIAHRQLRGRPMTDCLAATAARADMRYSEARSAGQ